MSKYLSEDQVYALNQRHGWFQYGDAQSDVSNAFANDAIDMYERIRSAAPDLLAFATEWLNSQGGDSNYMTEKARAVIAKATGEQS